MKKTVPLLVLIFTVHLNYAQQNFINVVSGEATEKHKIFFQQQLNINEIIQANTTIDYGLGKGWEIGLNLLGLDYAEKSHSLFLNDTNDRDPYDPLITINGMKQWELTSKTSLAIGSQAGVNFDFDKKERFASLAYANVRLEDLLLENSLLVAGPYYNSQHYGGRGNRVGAWVATEIPFNTHLHLLAESILGNNAISYTSLGIVYYPVRRVPLTLGIQIPNTKTNAYALVFELTITP
jgi:hypothetical protein